MNTESKYLFGPVDTVILNARIWTQDQDCPKAEAVAIRGEHILAVGSTPDIESLKSSATEVIDASGMTLLPGFIDSHCHPLMANEAIGANVNFRRISEVQDVLKEKAEETPPGEWVFGFMYDDTKFEEGRALHVSDLDAVSREHPIFVQHRGGHTAVVNSAAFELAGITVDTPDPEGGAYYRENGILTGKLAETAAFRMRGIGIWPSVTREVMQEAARLSTERMASTGLTSTTDAATTGHNLRAYQDALKAGELNCRISAMPVGIRFGGETVPLYETLKEAGISTGYGDNMLQIGSAKYLVDGSASERTMRMTEAYEGRPDDFGILVITQEEINAAVDDAVANQYRIGFHANGDEAIDMVLKAYERVLKDWQGDNPRFRIEHCSLVNPDLLERIKAVGAIPAPFYTYAYYHGEKWSEYGEERMKWMFAHRSFLDYEIPVAPASDYTPGPYDPLMALQSMVTRKDYLGQVWGENQKITVDEAIRICTMHGAYASCEEGIKGSITPGKLADMVLLAQDPHDVDPDTIKDIKVVRTILGGRATFEAS
jgi:predicted amidohydrolase YtcJ|tara:strand:- start:917 stop:2548 length:1632 start_codon:yes stop_codon:yes gene_type:complete